MHNSKPSACSCISVVAPVVELCDQVTLLLVVASWQYSYLVEVDPGVSNALSCFESRHVRNTSWGAVNVYAHVTSREHRLGSWTNAPRGQIHTNIPRDVGRTSPSMWGSLRLAPIMICCTFTLVTFYSN